MAHDETAEGNPLRVTTLHMKELTTIGSRAAGTLVMSGSKLYIDDGSSLNLVTSA